MEINAGLERERAQERPQVNEVVTELVAEYKMPGTIGRNFIEDYAQPEDENEACSKSHEKTLRKDAAKELETSLDPVSGLEVWKAVRKEIVREQIAFSDHLDELFNSEEAPDVLVKRLIGEMTISGRMAFIGKYQDVLSGEESEQEKWKKLQEVAKEAYIISEHSKRAQVSSDAQGLKNTNDIGSDMRVDMSGEEYVDRFGFQIWGRRKQALSVLLNSTEYSNTLQKLEGTTVEDQYDGYKNVTVGPEFYIGNVLTICEERGLVDTIKALRDRGVTIVPFREGDRGDESGMRIVVDGRDDKGFPRELEQQDINQVLELYTAVSETEVGSYSQSDKKDIQSRAQALFGARNKLVGDVIFNPSFIDRSGVVRQDEIIKGDNIITTADQLEAVLAHPEDIYAKVADEVFTQARIEMERRKKIETFDLMYDAVSGNSRAQQKIIELVRQNRFPGSVEAVAAELKFDKEQPMGRGAFDKRIASLMLKREEEPLE